MANCWPYPGDSPLARARRVAMAYRHGLEQVDPEACRELDRRFAEWGENWTAPRPLTYTMDDWLEPADAADIAATSVANIRKLRRAGRLPGKMGADGKWRYQARDVLIVISATRTRR